MYSAIHPVVGHQAFNEVMTPDTTQRFGAGMVLDAMDPYFGAAKFVYLQSGAAENPGQLDVVQDETFVTLALPSTANQGFPFVVARQVMGAANNWGWYQFEGVCPLQVSASVAQGTAIGIGTSAGKAGTNTAGKQLLGVRVLEASTFAITKLGITTNGDKRLFLTNVDGLFVGLAVSGTGVAASSTIAGIDPSRRFITLNNALTASGGGVTITFTYTGFVLAHLVAPFAQGAIT